MCNKCDGAMRYDEQTNMIYYRKNGQWLPVPPEALLDPDPPAPGDNETPTVNNACWKANGVWAAIELTADHLIEAMQEGGFILGSYSYFQSESSEVDADNAQVMDLLNALQYATDDIAAAWNAQKIDLRDNFLCSILSEFDNSTVLRDADIDKIRDFEWLATGILNDFMEQVDDIPESRWLKVMARNYAIDASTSCPCNNLGVPPAPDLPSDWEYEVVWEGESALLGWDTGAPAHPTDEEYESPDLLATGLGASVTLLVDNPPNTARRAVVIHRSISPDETTLLKSVELFWSDVSAATPNDGSPQRLLNVRFFDEPGADGNMEGSANFSFNEGPGYKKIEFANFALGEYVSARIFFQVAQHSGSGITTVSGGGVLQSAKFRGSGTNPFA